MLNNKVSKILPISNNLCLDIVLQTNIKRYLINKYQIYKMAMEKSQNIYIFLIFYTWLKIKVENLMLDKKLFQI